MKEIEFVKQVPSHPRDRLKRMSRKMSRNQDDVQFIKYVPPRDIQFIKQIAMHSRDRLERMVKDGEVKFVKQVPAHPRYRLQRPIRDTTAKVSVDKNLIKISKLTKPRKVKERKQFLMKLLNSTPKQRSILH